MAKNCALYVSKNCAVLLAEKCVLYLTIYTFDKTLAWIRTQVLYDSLLMQMVNQYTMYCRAEGVNAECMKQ